MTDYLVLLLSTDWFLPFWTEIGIDIADNRKLCIQEGCRHIIDELLNGDDNFFLISFSEDRRRVTREQFLALLRQCEAESEASATFSEWEKLSHRELTAVVAYAGLNAKVPSADGSTNVPYLEFAIRVEVMQLWEIYRLDPAIFRNICLNSNTKWDLRTQKLLSSQRTLVNQLWRVLLNHRFRSFWADLQQRLSSQQLQELVSWYRAVTKAQMDGDRPDLIPSYINGQALR